MNCKFIQQHQVIIVVILYSVHCLLMMTASGYVPITSSSLKAGGKGCAIAGGKWRVVG
jgi:hypothetical protein